MCLAIPFGLIQSPVYVLIDEQLICSSEESDRTSSTGLRDCCASSRHATVMGARRIVAKSKISFAVSKWSFGSRQERRNTSHVSMLRHLMQSDIGVWPKCNRPDEVSGLDRNASRPVCGIRPSCVVRKSKDCGVSSYQWLAAGAATDPVICTFLRLIRIIPPAFCPPIQELRASRSTYLPP